MFFDKRVRNFMSRTAITLKFKTSRLIGKRKNKNNNNNNNNNNDNG